MVFIDKPRMNSVVFDIKFQAPLQLQHIIANMIEITEGGNAGPDESLKPRNFERLGPLQVHTQAKICANPTKEIAHRGLISSKWMRRLDSSFMARSVFAARALAKVQNVDLLRRAS